MDDLAGFARASVIGLSIAAPVGPIGLLCIQRTLERGALAGFVSGLGAAAADGVYGAIAGFGLAAVSGALIAWAGWIRIGGGALLLWLAWSIARAPLAAAVADARDAGLAGAFASTFVLTLANPATILSFVAVFAGLGLASAAGDASSALVMIAGVVLGSAAWWLALAAGVGLLRARIGDAARRNLNRVSAAILAGFALWALFGP